MLFTLTTVNTKSSEYHPDMEFLSMEDLLAWVNKKGVEGLQWTSLLVTVLPERGQ